MDEMHRQSPILMHKLELAESLETKGKEDTSGKGNSLELRSKVSL